ncbi:hypothetical protein [Candidatus Phytoplasma meliae]|nr:hypothetical protein [Candidatus Phytoplasma meliae]
MNEKNRKLIEKNIQLSKEKITQLEQNNILLKQLNETLKNK